MYTPRLKLYLSVCLAAISLFFVLSPAFAENPAGGKEKEVSLAMFIPRSKPFWLSNVRYAQAAAQDLGIELEVIDFDDDVDFLLRSVERVCREGVSGIIFSAYRATGEAVLQIAEKYRTPSFMINTGIRDAEFGPRTKYKNWIGKMTPDDVQAGTTLIQQLVTMAGEAGASEYHILAIAGAPEQESSLDRRKGLGVYTKYAKDIASIPDPHPPNARQAH